MMVYKCKVCGGATIVDTQSGIATCEYCGTRQALPLFTEDSEQLLYESGNNYLMHSEYDKAESVFNQLLTIRPNAAELYWDLVLCKYGVTYVKDPQTGNYVPTCNRTHYTPIFSDENYRKAIELAVGEKKALFEADAKTIDGIQKGIIAVSKKEKPFDIFISYKETDAGGSRTEDSVQAQELYEKLTEAGYKVFFSRITLEDKVGTQYEPYIYGALYSSKVMLTVSSSKENLESAWVKNEWSRFLALHQQQGGKTLIPLYYNMAREDLPEAFAILAAQNMQAEDFWQELLRGIKKLIPLGVRKEKRRKQIRNGILAALAAILLLGGVGAAIILPKQMEEKRRLQEEEARIQAAQQAAQQAAEEKAAIEGAYQTALNLFDQKNYTAAADAFTTLGDYKDSADMLERCAIQPDYDAAMQLYYDGSYAAASWAFRDLAEYQDSPEMMDKAQRAWREQLATVAVDVFYGEDPDGAYYITANGEVKSFPNEPGKANAGVEINAHGKIVSIANHNKVYALYEDGYVLNSAVNNEMDADWEDVIQITPAFQNTNVALKADGTVVYAKGGYDDDWLEPVSQWKDIVALAWGREDPGWDWPASNAVLVGLDVHGNVHAVILSDTLEQKELEKHSVWRSFAGLSNIRQIALSIYEAYSYSQIDDEGEFELKVSFAALDKDNNLITYTDGKEKRQEKTNYKIVAANGEYGEDSAIFVVDQKGVLSKIFSNKTLSEDVVYVCNGYFVTRTGNIYYNVPWGGRPENTGIKTQVKDVWLEGNS